MSHSRLTAFTLIEVLIVVTIIGILTVGFYMSFSKQRQQAEDARTLAYLDRLKIAFEDYYNDHNCYPSADWFDTEEDCNSENLRPYLNAIKCDVRTGKPYVLETDATGCGWFRFYVNLYFADNPQAQKLWVATGGRDDYNYGISSSKTTVKIQNPTLTPTPSTNPGLYYCQSVGNCTSYNPDIKTCTPSFNDSNCTGSSGLDQLGKPITVCGIASISNCNP